MQIYVPIAVLILVTAITMLVRTRSGNIGVVTKVLLLFLVVVTNDGPHAGSTSAGNSPVLFLIIVTTTTAAIVVVVVFGKGYRGFTIVIIIIATMSTVIRQRRSISREGTLPRWGRRRCDIDCGCGGGTRSTNVRSKWRR